MDVNGEHLHCRTSSSESKAGPELSESESWGLPHQSDMANHDFPWFSMISHDFPWFSHDFPSLDLQTSTRSGNLGIVPGRIRHVVSGNPGRLSQSFGEGNSSKPRWPYLLISHWYYPNNKRLHVYKWYIYNIISIYIYACMYVPSMYGYLRYLSA